MFLEQDYFHIFNDVLIPPINFWKIFVSSYKSPFVSGADWIMINPFWVFVYVLTVWTQEITFQHMKYFIIKEIESIIPQ